MSLLRTVHLSDWSGRVQLFTSSTAPLLKLCGHGFGRFFWLLKSRMK